MKIKQNKSTLQVFIHFIAWFIIFLFPYFFFMQKDNTDMGLILEHQLVVVSSLLLVFYVNYFVLIERFLFKKKTGRYFVYNLFLVLAVGMSVHIWSRFYAPKPPQHDIWKNPTLINIFFILRDIFSLVLTVGLSIAVKMTGKWYKSESERQDVENQKNIAELSNLRQQMNPHFLFNTLNNIYALIEISPQKAQLVVLELSKLLRYVLYENTGNFVSLEKELTFIRNYIELMRIRIAEENCKIDVEIEVPDETLDKQVAPMLFISLVENAFKHGISHSQKSFIQVNIFQENNERLICRISNSYFPKNENDRSGSGIGLDNLRRRLELIYHDQYSLKIDLRDEKVYVAELILSFKKCN